jgi:hypothetical protein
MDRGRVLTAYSSAWAQTTGEAIREALEDCWLETSIYVSPLTDVVRGVGGLVDLILDVPVMFPGASITTVRQPDVHHDTACVPWRLRSTAPIRTLGVNFGRTLDGVDFVEFDDSGRIRRSTAFFGLTAHPAQLGRAGTDAGVLAGPGIAHRVPEADDARWPAPESSLPVGLPLRG